MSHPRQPNPLVPGSPAEIADRRRRYAELVVKLREWSRDSSGFDERVEPLIEEALRETAPRNFPEER